MDARLMFFVVVTVVKIDPFRITWTKSSAGSLIFFGGN
jgi:hypothetical protein